MMQLKEERKIQYPYDYRIAEVNFYAVTEPIGKLPKINLTLPKICIAENFEIKMV